jgi:hypothetical protein
VPLVHFAPASSSFQQVACDDTQHHVIPRSIQVSFAWKAGFALRGHGAACIPIDPLARSLNLIVDILCDAWADICLSS